MYKLYSLVTMLFALIYASSATAQDNNGALYDPVAPDNSAFIRVINLSNALITIDVEGKQSTQQVAAWSIGGYLFTQSGTVKAVIGGLDFNQVMQNKEVKTLIFQDSKITVIDDDYFDNRRKSRASFINLSEKTLSLKTSDGKHQLITPLTRGLRAERKLNEVKITLAIFDGDKKVGEYAEQIFKKGRSYSFIAYSKEEEVFLLSVADAIDPIL